MAKAAISKRPVPMTTKTPVSCASTRAAADSLKVSYPQDSDASLTSSIEAAKVERINERELSSISALLAYVAYNQNVQQETVEMVVEAQFGVDNVAKINRNDYMHAIEFLVDLRMDEVLN